MTFTARIVKLRKMGLKNKQIAKILGKSVNLCHVLWYRYQNKEKVREYSRNYIAKNRAIHNEYQRKWRAKNKDRIQEYWYRHKCRMSGVQPQ